MTKGKANNTSSESLAPAHPWSLRSRKRECPSDETSGTDDVHGTLHQQDTERNDTVDATLLQCHQPPPQESAMISAQQPQAAEQSCLTKQDPTTEEEHGGSTNVSSKNVMVVALEVQEETTVTSPNNDCKIGVFRVTNNEAKHSGKGKEEITTEDCNRSPCQTCNDQLQGDGFCATALEEQLCAKENSLCNLERNQEPSHEERSSVYMTDVKDVRQEAAAGLPAKKKRRMGMCGLTEKERSHFLQTQKRENSQNGPKRADKQICNNTADLVAQEEIISSPQLPFSLPVLTEQEKAEMTLQSSHCGGDDRAQTEVCIAVTTSNGTTTVCDPGYAKGESGEAEGDMVPALEQTGGTKSDPSAEEELLGNPEQQELDGHTAESMADKPQEQMKDGGDGSEVADQSPTISFYSNPMETEDQDAMEAAPVQENAIIRMRDEKTGELTCDDEDGDGAEAGASSTDSRSGGLSCGYVELCEAAVSPGGSERKDSTDPFGSGHLDYVSDSQLNAIALSEEGVMEREEDLGSSHYHDATDLVCGLIRELSSLNRTVMATHRVLENLRRSSKSSRSSIS
ncbi:uncharacterized protein [Chaetodon trifascialis]|uniref:uncharacterized protein n=1 Tax=Chaetodon trifascialis TaxID=109706 RepID=UPI003992D908